MMQFELFARYEYRGNHLFFTKMSEQFANVSLKLEYIYSVMAPVIITLLN